MFGFDLPQTLTISSVLFGSKIDEMKMCLISEIDMQR